MSSVVSALRDACGIDRVLTSPQARSTFARDALRPHRGFSAMRAIEQTPLAVVQPGSTADVAKLIQIASHYHTPLVPFGGGSGLMGGALSVRPGIVVDLQRMNAVLEIDEQALTARVQSGVRLRLLGERLAQQNLLLGHDPWSITIATVGGALSTNGLGYLGGRYGSMGEQLLGLEAVLGTGEIVRTTPARKRSTGPDIAKLLIGAEGTLGIITEATLQIFPRPEGQKLLGFHFPDFAAGFQALLAMQRQGVRSTSMDLSLDTWPKEIQGQRDDLTAEPTPLPYLVLYFEGFEQEVAAHTAAATSLAREYDGQPEEDPITLETYWSTRHAIADRWAQDPEQREGKWLDTPAGKAQLDFLHMVVPVKKLLDFRRQVAALTQAHGVTMCQEAVWIWPECYSLVLYCSPVHNADAPQAMRLATDAMLGLVQDIGGSIEYVHGLGVRLGHLAERELGNTMNALRRLKESFDPDGILNPGKLGLDDGEDKTGE